MNLVFPRLYAIIDPTLLTISELDLAEALAGSGVELIQYRNKTASSRQFFEISRQLSSALGPRGVRLIVNDRAGHCVACRRRRRACGPGRPGRRRRARHLRRYARPLGGSFHAHARTIGRGGPHFRRLHCLRPDFSDRDQEKSRPGRRDGTFAQGAADDEKAAGRDWRNHARTRGGSLSRGSGFAGRDSRSDLRARTPALGPANTSTWRPPRRSRS